jgi:hypothetical protein
MDRNANTEDGANSNSFLRRYAGHVENGKIGKSDPAIGLQYGGVGGSTRR